MAIKKRRSVHQTQWAAQFAVASELCKRGYEVALTMGNHPSVDIMARSQNDTQFGIDVKGLYARNHWVVAPKEQRMHLFYIFAYVPNDAANHFYIFTQEEVNAEIAANDKRAIARAAVRGKTIESDPFQGVPFAAAERYGDAWHKLPDHPDVLVHTSVGPAK